MFGLNVPKTTRKKPVISRKPKRGRPTLAMIAAREQADAASSVVPKRGRPTNAMIAARKAAGTEKETAPKRGPGRPKGSGKSKSTASSLAVAALHIDARRVKLRKKASACANLLSPAERVVYAKMIEGKSAKAIGAELGRSTFTISNHTRRIFDAFGTTSRSTLIAMLVVPLDAESSPLS